MPFNMTFQHNKIKAILVYLELKTTRELVGKLEYKNKKYCFSYGEPPRAYTRGITSASTAEYKLCLP